MFRKAIFTLLALSALCTGAGADRWPLPKEVDVYSRSREYLVRVIPGNLTGHVDASSSAPEGGHGRAKIFRLTKRGAYILSGEMALVNPVAPVDCFVSNNGYLVTLDNWYAVGHGKIIVFYSPNGRLLRSYELTDLFSEKEIVQFSRSVSSIRWRKFNAQIKDDQITFFVQSSGGKVLLFNIESGELIKLAPGQGQCRK